MSREELQENLIRAAREGQRLLAENGRLKGVVKRKDSEVASATLLLEKANKRSDVLLLEGTEEAKAIKDESANEIARLTDNLDQVRDAFRAEKNKTAALANEKQESDVRVKELVEQVRQLQLQNEQNRHRPASEQSTNDELADTLRKVDDEKTALEGKCKELDLKMQKIEQQNRLLQEDKQNDAEKIENLAQNLSLKADELSKLREKLDDLEFEKQTLLTMADSKATPTEIASTGNSLFSEVEDRRRVTAQELFELENTYKSKIAKFDDLTAENVLMRNRNHVLQNKLLKCTSDEEHNLRLVLEIKELRQARDEALSQVESLQTMVELVRKSQLEVVQGERDGDFYRRCKEMVADKDKEIGELHGQIRVLMLDKCGYSDRVRSLDCRLHDYEQKIAALEKENLAKKDQTPEPERVESPPSPLPTPKLATSSIPSDTENRQTVTSPSSMTEEMRRQKLEEIENTNCETQ